MPMTNRIQDLAEAVRLSRTGEARQVREAAGLGVSDVARACGVSPSAVSRWETGARTPKGAAAVAWARLTRSLRAEGDQL